MIIIIIIIIIITIIIIIIIITIIIIIIIIIIYIYELISVWLLIIFALVQSIGTCFTLDYCCYLFIYLFIYYCILFKCKIVGLYRYDNVHLLSFHFQIWNLSCDFFNDMN